MKTFLHPGMGYLGGLAAALASVQPLHAWQPGTGSPAAASGFTVDTTNRRDALAFYQCVYQASEGYASRMAWTGNTGSGQAGTTAAAFKEDVRRRVNFYRAMVGQPADITFNTTKSDKDQAAALMMSANNKLSHSPTASWLCYSATGKEAAGKSNLALGTCGPESVNGYMRDDGDGNEWVGHRRWVLHSVAKEMGTGDVPTSGTYRPANALWVIGDYKTSATAKFIAWPNEGYVPAPLVPARWSLGYPGADFSWSDVTMTRNGVDVPLTIMSNDDTGYGDNSIVWEPEGLPSSVTDDVPYVVTVTGISGTGVPTSKTYTVRLFNPDVLGETVTVSGPATLPASGQSYTFNAIGQADSYQVEVSRSNQSVWVEGAEDSPAPQVAEAVSPGYSLRQTGLVRTGSKAFQLTYPSGVFSDQAFVIVRGMIPSANSRLRFYDRARFSTTTTTLSAQVSADGGGTWTQVFSRNGVGLSSALWDADWILRDIAVGAYAGQAIQVRFVLAANGAGVVQNVTSNHGFFIDDVTVTETTQLANPVVTSLAGTATSFTLDSTTAGGSLTGGTSYVLRVRPNVGTHWFGYGAMKTVTVQMPTYATWIASQYPSVTGGPGGDHDRDGVANGVEYAFGTNPLTSTRGSVLPQAARVGGNLVFDYPEPTGVSGVGYGAEWSDNLKDWHPIADTGTTGRHTFAVATTGKTRLYLRHKVVVTP